jgi:hypothetical protein
MAALDRDVPAPVLTTPAAGTERALWLFAVLTFGVGDLATTAVGLAAPGVVEGNPLAVALLERSTLGALVALKGGFLLAAFAAWRVVPAPHRVGIPLGLATVGVAVTGWNLHVVVAASTQ